MSIKKSNSPFSTLNRITHLEQLQNETFDLLVIGGGVTGCGIALDAASRGLKTALRCFLSSREEVLESGQLR